MGKGSVFVPMALFLSTREDSASPGLGWDHLGSSDPCLRLCDTSIQVNGDGGGSAGIGSWWETDLFAATVGGHEDVLGIFLGAGTQPASLLASMLSRDELGGVSLGTCSIIL